MTLVVEIIKYLLPVFAVAIGWMLSQLGERNKWIREDKRKLKRTLFYLLEIRYHLKLFEIDDESIDTLYSMIKDKLGRLKEVQELSKENFKLVVGFFIGGLKNNKPQVIQRDVESLNKTFVQCIDTLSEVDPLLAFRLKGKENIQQTLKEALEGTKSSILEYVRDANDVSELQKAVQHFEPKILSETLRDLEAIMLDVANQIGKSTLRQTKKKIASQSLKRNDSEIEGILDRIMEGMPVQ